MVPEPRSRTPGDSEPAEPHDEIRLPIAPKKDWGPWRTVTAPLWAKQKPQYKRWSPLARSRPHPHPPSRFLPGRDRGIALSPQGDLKQTLVSGTLTPSCLTSGMPSRPLPAPRASRALGTWLNCILRPPSAQDRQKWSPRPGTARCQHTGSRDTGSAPSRDPRDPRTV